MSGIEDEPDHILLPRNAPVGQLPPQEWLTAPETRAVVAALAADGAEVRFAGGCVRDAMLRRPVRDIDLATPTPPPGVMELLARAGIRAIPTGIAHGTVTAIIGERHFEITTLRVDVETDGRRARVAFTDDWLADAARRDFTINALYALPDGSVIDPWEGLADLAAGRIRFIGDPKARIEEDGLRILRFFRFYAHYGQPPADILALDACRGHAAMIDDLSGERVRGELMRLLEAPDPAPVLVIMQGEQVLPHVVATTGDFGRLRMLTFLETRGVVRPDVTLDPLRRLAAILPADAAVARGAAERLRFSRADRERLVALAAPARLPVPAADPADLDDLLDRVGPDEFRDLALLAWAARRAIEPHSPSAPWIGLLDRAASWQKREPPVTGDDVLAAGVPAGPRVGTLLAELGRWWRRGGGVADRAETLENLRALIAENGVGSEDR